MRKDSPFTTLTLKWHVPKVWETRQVAPQSNRTTPQAPSSWEPKARWDHPKGSPVRAHPPVLTRHPQRVQFPSLWLSLFEVPCHLAGSSCRPCPSACPLNVGTSRAAPCRCPPRDGSGCGATTAASPRSLSAPTAGAVWRTLRTQVQGYGWGRGARGTGRQSIGDILWHACQYHSR